MRELEGSLAGIQRLALAVGPALGLIVYLLLPQEYAGVDGLPVEFGHAGRATAGVAVWMAIWWFTEAIPVYATALLPLVALPLLQATPIKAAAAPYAHELIFLFMGGFLLALTMERWGLHRRVALGALRLAGDRPVNVVGAFMAVSAGLSMWISNTAATIMMLPVALSVIDLLAKGAAADESQEPDGSPGSSVRSFAVALLLGIAYGASIGGIGTPIGTPPNLFLLSYARAQLDREISFVRWMALALPLVVLFLPVAWLLLTRVLHPVRLPRIAGGAALLGRALRALGPMKRGERIALGVFVLTSGLWITRPLLTAVEIAGIHPLAGLSDASIAMLAALLLFVSPVDWRAGTFALDWETAVKLPWGILVLFGGGLSLAAAIRQNGVAELIGSQVSAFAGVPSWVAVLAVVAVVIFLTELTSNTATTAALVPVLASLAPGLGFDPLLLAVPAAVAASCAFMLPIATPPNAVVFGSGLVRIPEMVRAGFWLNLLGIFLITLLTYAVAMPVLGMR